MALFFSASSNKKVRLAPFGLKVAGTQTPLVIVSGSFGAAKLFSWGFNTYGGIGDNSTTQRNTPVSVAGSNKTFCEIVSTLYSSNGIDKNGRAWGWGWNTFGGIGDNSTSQRNTPVSILGAVKTFCKITTLAHTMALTNGGRAWGWGANYNGGIGDNTITDKLTPVSVLGAVKTFCEITSTGLNSTAAIDKNGRIWTWGPGVNGILGDNTTVSKLTPVSVLGEVKTFCKITSANSSVLALDKNGRLWAWGLNDVGQLGDNTIANKSTPVSVLGAVKTFCKINAIAGGSDSFSAIDKDGFLWAWGDNTYGQLGDGTIISRRTPVQVYGNRKYIYAITCGANTYAIDTENRVWAWGRQDAGSLGVDPIPATCVLTPIRVYKL